MLLLEGVNGLSSRGSSHTSRFPSYCSAAAKHWAPQRFTHRNPTMRLAMKMQTNDHKHLHTENFSTSTVTDPHQDPSEGEKINTVCVCMVYVIFISGMKETSFQSACWWKPGAEGWIYLLEDDEACFSFGFSHIPQRLLTCSSHAVDDFHSQFARNV